MINTRALTMAAGIIAGIAIAFFAIRRLNENNRFKTEYDERQQAARGKGYMVGFYTAMACLACLMVFDSGNIPLPMTDAVRDFTVIIISIFAMCAYCIIKDAYWGLNNNRRSYSMFMVFIGIINLISPIMAWRSGELITDGKLQGPFINLECAILLLLLGALIAAKDIRDRGEEGGDEA